MIFGLLCSSGRRPRTHPSGGRLWSQNRVTLEPGGLDILRFTQIDGSNTMQQCRQCPVSVSRTFVSYVSDFSNSWARLSPTKPAVIDTHTLRDPTPRYRGAMSTSLAPTSSRRGKGSRFCTSSFPVLYGGESLTRLTYDGRGGWGQGGQPEAPWGSVKVSVTSVPRPFPDTSGFPVSVGPETPKPLPSVLTTVHLQVPGLPPRGQDQQ